MRIHLRAGFFLELNYVKKDNQAQVFSCEFCKIFKNTFFTEYFCTTAFVTGHYAAENKRTSHNTLTSNENLGLEVQLNVQNK